MTYSPNVVFLGNRIMAGNTEYYLVISKRPDYKEELDAYLIEEGLRDLITS